MPLAPALVLVVDDDLAVGDSLKFALEIDGFAIRVCSGGEAALAHPDLLAASCILLDYKMPGMDGFALLQRLAAHGVTTPVILMTAHVTPWLRQRAAAYGVKHVLEKPLFNGNLLAAIDDILART
jgi:FixJ family two-component response regulator